MNVKNKKYEVVSKGTCDYPQTENFVAVKQFLIITENDRRYLLVKLVNNYTENVTGATLLVEQYNDRGEKIAADNVQVDGFNGYPKKSFTVETKIPVAPTCIDCRITVSNAEFGKYICSADDTEQPKYKLETNDKMVTIVPANVLKKAGKKGVTVEPRSLKMPILVLIISLALLAVAFIAIWVYTSRFVSTEDRFLHDGVYYAFENDDRSDGSNIYVVGVRGAKSEISVPADIQGHKVVRVGDSAFLGNSYLKKVNLAGETEIGDKAFFGCVALENITFNKVTVINDFAFAGCAKLKSVELDNVNYIGSNAFGGCGALKSVKISGSGDALQVGDSAFGNCVGLRSVEIDRELDYSAMTSSSAIFSFSFGVSELYLKNFECGDNGERTIASLFDGVPSLSTLVIDSIDTIGPALCAELPITTARFNAIGTPAVRGRAFYNCENLSEVILPTAMTAVGYEAFYGTAIKSFDGSALELLDDNAFSECKSLTSFTLEHNTKLAEIGTAAFKGCTELESMVIPAHVTWLGAEIFSGCNNLASVKFEDDSEIRIISQSAFEGCVKLASISLPASVTTLGAKTFSGCSALTSIELPQSLTTLGAEVFAGTGLTTVAVPNSVLSIARGAFSGCEGLQSITVPFVGGSRTSNVYLSYIFGATSGTDGGKVPASLNSVTVTDSTIAANNAFNGCASITGIVYSNGLSSIGNNAFYGCAALESITLEPGIARIGNNAFNGCAALTEITLPNSLTEIGRNVFGGCDNLTSLTTPFVGGSRVDNTYLAYMFGGDVTESDKIPSSLRIVKITDTETIESGAFAGTSVKEVVLGDATKHISADAFKNNRKLNIITLSRGLESIGDNAFYGCYFLYEVFNFSEALQEKIIAGDESYGYVAYYALKVHVVDEPRLAVASYDGYDFVENDSMWHLVRYPEDQAELVLPNGENGVIITEDYSFTDYELRGRLFRDNTTITSVHVPSNVTGIGMEAFCGCENLVKVTVEDGVNEICESAFSGCESLTAFTFPSGIATVADRVFYGCTSLETVTLPEKAQGSGDEDFTIGAEAFSGCESLKKISLPIGCTKIGDSAFYDCAALTAVSVPNSCTKIGDAAFSGCIALCEIAISAACREIGDNAFFGCKRIKTVTLPQSLVAIGENAFYGCTKLYEVYNLTDWELLKGTEDYGYVAAYAYTIHTSADDKPLDNIVTDDGLHYYKLDGQWCLVDYYGDSGVLEVGAFAYDGAQIEDDIWILEYAFQDYDTIKSISITDQVTQIGYNAFGGCVALESVEITAISITVGDEAFSGCESLSSLSVTGSDYVYFQSGAFKNCALEDVVLNGGVYEIDSYVFSGNPALKLTADCDDFVLNDGFVFGDSFAEADINCSNAFVAADYAFKGAVIDKLTVNAKSVTIGEANFNNDISEMNITGTTSVVLNSNAFTDSKLNSIGIEGGKVTLNALAFSSCEVFDNLSIVGEQIVIGTNAVNNCTIGDFTVSGETAFGDVNNDGAVFVNTAIKNLAIVSDEIYFDHNMFYDCEIGEIALVGDVEFYTDGVVFSNTSIEKLDITCGDIEIPLLLDVYSSISELSISGNSVAIYQNAFNVQYAAPNSLTAIDISADVSLSIGMYAFYAQSGLSSVKLTADNNAEIGEYAFATDWSYPSQLSSVVLPNGLKKINNYTFSNCSVLTELTIPASVTSIGDFAFCYCLCLRALELPAGLKTLGYYAFASCNDIRLLNIPDSVTSIGDGAFSDCTSLTKLTISDSITSIGPYTFSSCGALKELVIPESVTGIGDYAFSDCRELTELVIPDSVTSIGEYAFNGCSKIKTLSLSNKLSDIGNSAFNDCYSLTALEIPGTVTSIGSYAFSNCGELTELIIPNSVDYIYNNAFSGCAKLKTLQLSENLETIDYYTFNGCTSLTELTIPNSVTSIRVGAFSDCNSLTTLKLSNNLTSIGENAFSGCNSLTELVIPNKVTAIDNEAFRGCRQLEKLTLYGNIEYIGSYAFSGCSALTGLKVTAKTALTICDYAFYGCEALANVDVGNVNYIGDSAFEGCKAVNDIKLSFNYDYYYGDNHIGSNAFNGCESVKSIIISASDYVSIYSNAFYGCTALTDLELSKVSYIGVCAFYGCGSLSEIDLNNVYYIYDFAFYGCKELTELELSNVSYIGSYAFSGCSKLKYVELPASLTYIGEYAFENATSLFAVCNLSNMYISVGSGDYDYGGVAKYAAVVTSNSAEAQLTYVQSGKYKFVRSGTGTWYLYETDGTQLPESVTTSTYGRIDKYIIKCHTFENFVDEIVIPTSVVGIQNSAFYGWLGNVYYKGTAAQWRNVADYTNAGDNIYYYVACVHNSYEWTYKNGNINTDIQPMTEWKTVTEPTCTSKGKAERHCQGCGQREEERDIDIDPDAHDYVNGKCKRCGEPDPDYDEQTIALQSIDYVDEKKHTTRELNLND